MLVAVLAFMVDGIIGDPRSKFHPVVLIGRLIAALERLLYNKLDSARVSFFKGILLNLMVLAMSYSLMWFFMEALASYINEGVFLLIQALLLSFVISPKSLAEAGREIYFLLAENNLPRARYKVGWIVGRDTENLSEGEVARATIETVAENTVDGITAPLFFFFIGGIPLAFLYRAANTLDSMVGYKNEKYLYFGRFSARVDDVLNYIPARLTGLLFVLVAFILKYNYKNAWKILRRDAKKHPSPNGGWSEAPVAGALNIRLGGINYYFGKKSFRAYMGEEIQALSGKHILECIRMMYGVSILFLLLLHLCSYLPLIGQFIFTGA